MDENKGSKIGNAFASVLKKMKGGTAKSTVLPEMLLIHKMEDLPSTHRGQNADIDLLGLSKKDSDALKELLR